VADLAFVPTFRRILMAQDIRRVPSRSVVRFICVIYTFRNPQQKDVKPAKTSQRNCKDWPFVFLGLSISSHAWLRTPEVLEHLSACGLLCIYKATRSSIQLATSLFVTFEVLRYGLFLRPQRSELSPRRSWPRNEMLYVATSQHRS
jgi:hypothetical protein